MAKLERLRNAFTELGYDTDFGNYDPLGIIGDQRFNKAIGDGRITLQQIPRHSDYCLCGQGIERNFIIKHLKEQYVLSIGSCCFLGITQRNTELRKLTCMVEGCNNRHGNRKYAVCNDHKEEEIKKERAVKREVAKREKIERAKKQKRAELYGNRIFGFGRTFYNTKINEIPDWYIKWVKKEQIDNQSTRMLFEYCEAKRYLNQ